MDDFVGWAGFFFTGHPLDGVIDHIRLVADSDLAATARQCVSAA